MLTFNLNQADRVAIHRRICYATISAKELALVSSTDLANEETKLSIKIAEQQALEHSILQKTAVPRAKITHKGLQDIEDLNGGVAALEREKEREREEEERRERERQARHRAAEQHQKQRAISISQGSVPPESPVVLHTPAWGVPLPASVHAMPEDSFSPAVGDSEKPLPSDHPLFTASAASDYRMPLPELELDIADLIHLDEEPAAQRDSVPDRQPAMAAEESVVIAQTAPTVQPDAAPISGSPVTETSSQVPKPETPVRLTFDLNTLWSAPKIEAVSQGSQGPLPQEIKDRPTNVDATVHQEATDQDFDMFLEKDNETQAVPISQPPEDTETIFKAIPPVWHGEVRRLDSGYESYTAFSRCYR